MCTQRHGLLCELVEGVLVEKLMGFRESFLTIALSAVLWGFVRTRNLGLVTGADGMLPARPRSGPYSRLGVYLLAASARATGADRPHPGPRAGTSSSRCWSEGNTAAEMNRKRHEYFTAGVRLAWFVDPVARTVEVYTAPDHPPCWDRTDARRRHGPGRITLPVAELFAELDRQGAV